MLADRYVTSVDVIDLEDVWSAGIRALLLDRDNTLIPRSTGIAPVPVQNWIHEAHRLGFQLCLLSNNKGAELEKDARSFGAELISDARKPLPFAAKRALVSLHVEPREALMIGDQLYTDILAGKLAGIPCVQVKPQCEHDLWYSPPLRALERLLLGKNEPSSVWEPLCRT